MDLLQEEQGGKFLGLTSASHAFQVRPSNSTKKVGFNPGNTMLQRFSADMQILHPNSGGNAITYNRGSAREGKRNTNAANNLGSGLVVI